MSNSAERKQSSLKPAITINNILFEWNEQGHGYKSFGIDSISLWIKPSLQSILLPLCEELGEDLYSRLVAFESSKGTYEDYHSMVSTLGQTFEEGFLNWGVAVSASSWGQFSILEMNWDQKRAVIRIDKPWELCCFVPEKKQNHVPFLSGKISGIFSHAFKTNCRAEVLTVETGPVKSYAILEIKASSETLEDALMKIKSTPNNELRAINNSLRRSQRRFLDVIETTDEFIFETDLYLKFNYATQQASSVLGISSNILNLSWGSVLDGQEKERLTKLLEELSETKKFVETDFIVRHEGKANRHLRIRVKKLLDFTDNHVGFIGSARDITLESNLKEQLGNQQEIAVYSAKMATLGEMAGGVAHEINTPLAVISMLAEQLIEEMPDQSFDPGRSEKALNQILATTERIGKIIQGLRTFARDATQDPMNEVSLGNIYNETMILCQNRLRNHGVNLRIDPIDLDIKIRCRSTQISQVLINLLNNAFDAVAHLKEKWVHIETSISETYLEIRVIDSGDGIPQSVQQKLMQPFFTTKPTGKGTGLGLSISKGIIDSHAGMLYVDSKHEHTCFVIRLPL